MLINSPFKLVNYSIIILPFDMDSETQSFIKIWFTATLCAIYCYYVTARLHGGTTRLLSLLPVFYLFTTLPLLLTSVHVGTATILYLVWIANFKLLLFSFNQGPLYSTPPLPLLHFIPLTLLPIRAKHAPTTSNDKNYHNPTIEFAVKVFLVAIILRTYGYRAYLHPYIILALYCIHLYLAIDLILTITAFPARAILGMDLEPQFNEPYFSTSLQDFWGRRWNLMVTNILRQTVYNPVRRIFTRILGTRWGRHPATVTTFLVSGLMHELLYYYLSRAYPTWEVTWFFVLNGACVAVEMAVKRAVAGRWRLHRLVSGPLTVAFVGVTGALLFLPQVIRHGIDIKAISEYSVMGQFVKDCLPLIYLPSSF